MLYTINNAVHFRDTDGVIWSGDDQDAGIQLTSTMSRLLKFLLDKQGEVAFRDDILQVWDAHGLRTSNNSLNKYISDLRAIFKNFGIEEEIITTVPRLGFNIAKTNLVIRTEKSPDLLSTTPPADKRSTSGFAPFLKKTNSVPFLAIFVLLIVVSAIILAVQLKTNTASRPINLYTIGQVNGCEAETFKKVSGKEKVITSQIAGKLLEDYSIVCQKNSRIYIQVADSIYYGQTGRVFLSICKSDSKSGKKIKACYNLYEPHYENKN